MIYTVRPVAGGTELSKAIAVVANDDEEALHEASMHLAPGERAQVMAGERRVGVVQGRRRG